MSDIFLSYASEDRDRARELAGVFRTRGWSVFWDRTIPPGKTWDEIIEEAKQETTKRQEAVVQDG